MNPRSFPSIVLALIMLSLGLSGCRPNERHSSAESSELPNVAVQVQTVNFTLQPLIEEVVGTIRSKQRASIEAKVNGRVTEMPVRLGSAVKKGQLLARLEALEIRARLNQAEAALDQAERDWKRISALFEQKDVTQAEHDSTQARYRMAMASVAEASAMMDYAEITAPFDGVVTRRWAEVGDLAAPGKALLQVEDPAVLQLDADVPESIASSVVCGSTLIVHTDAADRDVAGVVTEVAPAADPVSRTFQVKLDLPSQPDVMPGQFARLAVPIGKAQMLRVPESAVVRRGQLEIVFTVADQRARLRLVKVGKRLGDEVEILSGIPGGCDVVIDGGKQLSDGQRVEVR